jgi:hypothetical protein
LGAVPLATIPPSVLSFTVSPSPGVAYFEGSARSFSFQFVNQLKSTTSGLINSVLGYPTVSTVTTLVKP